jgi:hypothetical protein
VRDGLARRDGADVRIAYWDGRWALELPRSLWAAAGEPGWRITFSLVGGDPESERYYLYYGRSEAVLSDAPVLEEGDEPGRKLVLALGPQQAVEWGPTVTWTAYSTSTQTLVSPDGRLVFEHPAGGLRRDTRVRLRIVPAAERSGFGPLPDYEFHADPPPVAQDDQIARWDPPIRVSINWAGLPGAASSPTWAHFRYDTGAGAWVPVPIEFDAETGVIVFTTDQP